LKVFFSHSFSGVDQPTNRYMRRKSRARHLGASFGYWLDNNSSQLASTGTWAIRASQTQRADN
jgi:hypothetical protein